MELRLHCLSRSLRLHSAAGSSSQQLPHPSSLPASCARRPARRRRGAGGCGPAGAAPPRAPHLHHTTLCGHRGQPGLQDQVWAAASASAGLLVRSLGPLGSRVSRRLPLPAPHLPSTQIHCRSLRAIDPERFSIVDESRDGAVLEEIEESKAFFQVYDGAVYLYQVRCASPCLLPCSSSFPPSAHASSCCPSAAQPASSCSPCRAPSLALSPRSLPVPPAPRTQGRSYLCKRLDLERRVAVVRPADLKYYTKRVVFFCLLAEKRERRGPRGGTVGVEPAPPSHSPFTPERVCVRLAAGASTTRMCVSWAAAPPSRPLLQQRRPRQRPPRPAPPPTLPAPAAAAPMPMPARPPALPAACPPQ